MAFLQRVRVAHADFVTAGVVAASLVARVRLDGAPDAAVLAHFVVVVVKRPGDWLSGN